jgi:MFS family permease
VPKNVFYGWVVVGVAVIAVLMTAGSRAAPGALLVDMERSTGWSTSTLSIAASISLVMYGAGGPLAAFVMSRIGLRSTTVMSLLLAAVSFLFSARTESLWSFYLWFGFGAGLASGLIASVLGATIANRWFVDRRGLVTGILVRQRVLGCWCSFHSSLRWLRTRGGVGRLKSAPCCSWSRQFQLHG